MLTLSYKDQKDLSELPLIGRPEPEEETADAVQQLQQQVIPDTQLLKVESKENIEVLDHSSDKDVNKIQMPI